MGNFVYNILPFSSEIMFINLLTDTEQEFSQMPFMFIFNLFHLGFLLVQCKSKFISLEAARESRETRVKGW